MTGESGISGGSSTFQFSSASTTSIAVDGSVRSTTVASSHLTQDFFSTDSCARQPRRIASHDHCHGNPLMRAMFGGLLGGGAGCGFALIFGFNPFVLLILGLLLGLIFALMLGRGTHGREHCHEPHVHGRLLGGQHSSLEINQTVIRLEQRRIPPAAALPEPEEIPEHTIDPHTNYGETPSLFPDTEGGEPRDHNITHVRFTPDPTPEEPNPQEQTLPIPKEGLVVGNIRVFRNGTFRYEGGAPTLTNNRITLLNGSNAASRVTIKDD